MKIEPDYFESTYVHEILVISQCTFPERRQRKKLQHEQHPTVGDPMTNNLCFVVYLSLSIPPLQSRQVGFKTIPRKKTAIKAGDTMAVNITIDSL
jgi:hypothetical protein